MRNVVHHHYPDHNANFEHLIPRRSLVRIRNRRTDRIKTDAIEKSGIHDSPIMPNHFRHERLSPPDP